MWIRKLWLGTHHLPEMWTRGTHRKRTCFPWQTTRKLLTPGARSRASEGEPNKAKHPTNIPTLSISSVSTYGLTGFVNGTRADFLVDTGAAVTLIRKKVWESIKGRQV